MSYWTISSIAAVSIMTDRRSFLKTSALALPGLSAIGTFHSANGAPQPGGPWLSDLSRTLPDYVSVDEEDYWAAVQKLYALTDSRIYMNTGGLGPVSFPVLERFRELTTDLQMQSETGHRFIEEARKPVATFLGAKPEEIAFIRNATEGNATVASGLDLKKGDEIIIDASAHPGGAIPWLNQLKIKGVRIRVFDPTGLDAQAILDRIESLVSERTRVVQVSHITAPTGILMPVDEIAILCKEKNIWFHIDGAQSMGMMPINLPEVGCDSFATSGHKWLGAMHGTGVLYIKKASLDEVRPSEVGAYSDAGYALPDTFNYVASARRHESGTRNAPLVESVRVACEFMAGIGLQRVRDRGLYLTNRLRTGLTNIDSIEILTPSDDSIRASMLTFKSSKMGFSDLNRSLSASHKLRLRIVTEQDFNAIRVSLHVFNSPSQVDHVIQSVGEVLSTI